MKVLITGITGHIGQLVAELAAAAGHQICGVDRRPWPDAPSDYEMITADIRKRSAEEAFRKFRPDAVIHMATVTHLSAPSHDRYRINLRGTKSVFEHAHKYGARKAIFVGRHTYYGAAPDAPLYHSEDSPPMAMTTFPELADLVAADLYAGSALWRFPKLQTIVLRHCYTLGPTGSGTLASFIKGPRVPIIAGYDPLFQFMHEFDHARAICAALETDIKGVFNVAGLDPLPLSILIREAGRTAIPVPARLLNIIQGRFKMPKLPKGAQAHIKYPVVIDSSPFSEATGFEHQISMKDTINSFRFR